VIVTGGTRGTGAAIARNLAKLGHPVAVNYVASKDAAETVVSAIQAAGAKAAAIPGNVSSPAHIEAISTAAEAALGSLAHLVNNAGITGKTARVEEQDADSLTRLFAVNVVGTMLCTVAAARRLSTRHGGKGGNILKSQPRTEDRNRGEKLYESPSEYVQNNPDHRR